MATSDGNHPSLPTEFAPAERASPYELAEDAACFEPLPDHLDMLDAVPDLFMVVNGKRQIVYANEAVRRLAETAAAGRTLLGLRPGELIGCMHADAHPGGCGTAQACSTCGAVKAVLAALGGRACSEECRIALPSGDALDLRVWSTPLERNGRRYVMVAVQDISHEKRRRILERIFFHDVLNTAGVLSAALDLVQHEDIPFELVAEDLEFAANRLVDEIKNQQVLSAAENDDLTIEPEPLDPVRLLQEVARTSQHYSFAQGITIAAVAAPGDDVIVNSDRVLLTRVIANLTKNALEASQPGDTVTLAYTANEDSITFAVHNPAYMPLKVQLQVFKRSFSTKGQGRGLGTYSIKLLGERYLGGRVWFETEEAAGTTFKLSLPLQQHPTTAAD